MTTPAVHTVWDTGRLSSTEAAVLYAARDIRVEERPLPPLGPHDVLIELKSGGICGSDMHYFAEGRNGTNVLQQPTVLGHEAAGVVVAAGPDSAHGPGTAVVIEPSLPCGTCPTCLSGHANVCPHGACFGSPPTDGLFARHAVVPGTSAHSLPAAIPAEIGAAIEPLAVAVWAVERAQVEAGQRVLVTGAGPIGLLVAQVLAARGAGEIVVTDVNDHRLSVALGLGATDAVNTATGQLTATGLDRLIECSGTMRALVDGVRALRPAARAVVVGQAKPTVDGLPLGFLQRYEIDLVPAFRYNNAFPTAIGLAASGRVDVRSIITGTYPLHDVAAALEAPVIDPTHLKVLITY